MQLKNIYMLLDSIKMHFWNLFCSVEYIGCLKNYIEGVICMRRTVMCIIFLVTLISTSHGGGAWIYENGTSLTGTASAGYATGSGNDASCAFGNPATMSLLDSSQILVGALVNFLGTEFALDTASFTGGDGGEAGTVLPSGGIYYVHNLPLPLKLGFVLNSYVAGTVEYNHGWSGRYYNQKSTLLTFNANPVASWRLLPWMSVGAGISLGFARIDQQAALNNSIDSAPDGTIKASGNQVALGGNGGLLFEPGKKIRVGVTYRSPQTYTFSDIINISDVGPTLTAYINVARLSSSSSKIKVTIPQEAAAGVYIPVTDKVTVMIDANWQDWSSFGHLDVQIPSTSMSSFSVKQKLNDTWHIATGVHYQLNNLLLLTTGFAYDSSPSETNNRTPSLPVDRQLRYAGGIRYNLQNKLTIGGAYEFIDLGTSPINLSRGLLSGVLKGKYDTNSDHVVSLTLASRF
jgi:long-chain fatty acid transport protein